MRAGAVVFGGYGTFGSHVARDLVRLGVRPVVVAGRDGARAEAFARALGEPHRGLAADATDAASCREALRGRAVAISCAGPFSGLGGALLDACLEEGCHYADIADDRAYARAVRARGSDFAARGLVAATGCSSLPAISGALAIVAAAAGEDARPARARVTLFIGNRNPKGEAAVRAAVSVLGRPIEAPQGTIRGFRDREVVHLPPPFGRRAVYNFESPDYDLLPSLVGAAAVAVKVGFELRLATAAFAALAAVGGPRFGARTARLLARASGLAGWLGVSGGAVQVELVTGGGDVRRAALSGAADGQRMAALPCALVGRALAEGPVAARGAVLPWDLVGGAGAMLRAIAGEGFALTLP